MDHNGFYLYSSEGATNDLRQQYPALLDARSGQAQNRLPAALPVPDQGCGTNLFQHTERVLNNSNELLGTDTFNAHDYIHVVPGCESDSTSNIMHFGYHSDLQLYGDSTIMPSEMILGGDHFPWIPEPQFGIMPEATAIPFNTSSFNQIDPITLLSSQQSLNGTTMVQSSTNLRYPEQLSLQGSETVLGEFSDGQAMDYYYDAPNPTELALSRQEDSQQFEIFSQPLLTSGNMIEPLRPVINNNLSGPASHSACSQDMISQLATKQVAPTLGIKKDAKETRSEGRCVRCKRKKIKVSPPVLQHFTIEVKS